MDIKNLAHELTVEEIVSETRDAASFVFTIPEELKAKFSYKAGQFITLIFNIDQQEVKRSYSLSSSPVTDKKFSITVKRVEGGLVSNHLMDKVKVGDKILSTPPAGLFTPSKLDQPKMYLLFAGGSGITPMYSILKTLLASNDESKAALIYSNRNESRIIFNQELKSLKNKYTDRFQVFHCLSKPLKECDYSGRLCNEHLDKVWNNLNDELKMSTEAYLCGPDGFMETAKNFLTAKGFNKSNLFQESFNTPDSPSKKTTTSSTPKPAIDKDWVLIGDKSSQSKPETLEVLLNGESFSIPYNGEQSVLEALLEKGKNPPYSCMDGACMACLGKVTEGLVYQEDPGVLADENIADKETLTCQAKGLSTKVRIDFDNL